MSILDSEAVYYEKGIEVIFRLSNIRGYPFKKDLEDYLIKSLGLVDGKTYRVAGVHKFCDRTPGIVHHLLVNFEIEVRAEPKYISCTFFDRKT